MAGLIHRANRALTAYANRRWIWAMFLLTVVTFYLMAFVIAPQFSVATGGLRPFDMNFGIGAERVYADLPAYTTTARTLYAWFAIVDYVYPFSLAAFFALLWAWWFRRLPMPMFLRLKSAGVLLLPFVFTLIDWSENVGFLWVIFAYPSEYPTIADMAGSLKTLKPIVEGVVLIITLFFLTVYLVQRRKGSTSSAPSFETSGD